MADTLSPAPITSQVDMDAKNATVEEPEALMQMCVSHLPASTHRIDVYRTSLAADPTCTTVINYCSHEWPDKNELNHALIPYWTVRGELTVPTTCYSEVVGSWFHNPCKRRHCKSSTRVMKGFRDVDCMLGHLSGGRQYVSKSTT